MPANAHYRSNAQRAGTTDVDPSKVHAVMHEFKKKKLHSGGSGKIVKNRK